MQWVWNFWMFQHLWTSWHKQTQKRCLREENKSWHRFSPLCQHALKCCWTQWHACFYNSWRMYGNAQTAWIQHWRFWGDIDVNWSLLQRAGKTPLLQSITSLPFGTTLLITVKHGTEDERGWAETQTQSQGVHETPSDTATYCELRCLAIQRIVKL